MKKTVSTALDFPKCCTNGVLDEVIHYQFCDLTATRYCGCPVGRAAFESWRTSSEVQNAVQRRKRREVENFLAFSDLPKNWREKTLESIKQQESVKRVCQHYIENFPKMRQQGRGLYLWSQGSGRGKTHFLMALCQELIEKYTLPAIFMTEERIYQKLRECFDDKTIFESERLSTFLKVPLLCIDDLGATKASSWKNETLTAILDYRLNQKLPTCFTSNYHPDDYTRVLPVSATHRPERVASRIHALCRGLIMEVKGRDWRKNATS